MSDTLSSTDVCMDSQTLVSAFVTHTIDPRKVGTRNLPACFEAMMVAGQEQVM